MGPYYYYLRKAELEKKKLTEQGTAGKRIITYKQPTFKTLNERRQTLGEDCRYARLHALASVTQDGQSVSDTGHGEYPKTPDFVESDETSNSDLD